MIIKTTSKIRTDQATNSGELILFYLFFEKEINDNNNTIINGGKNQFKSLEMRKRLRPGSFFF